MQMSLDWDRTTVWFSRREWKYANGTETKLGVQPSMEQKNRWKRPNRGCRVSAWKPTRPPSLRICVFMRVTFPRRSQFRRVRRVRGCVSAGAGRRTRIRTFRDAWAGARRWPSAPASSRGAGTGWSLGNTSAPTAQDREVGDSWNEPGGPRRRKPAPWCCYQWDNNNNKKKPHGQDKSLVNVKNMLMVDYFGFFDFFGKQKIRWTKGRSGSLLVF